MRTSPLATDVQHYLESCSPAGLTLLELDIVEDVAELTLAFTPEALDRVLRSWVRSTRSRASGVKARVSSATSSTMSSSRRSSPAGEQESR